VTWLAQIVVHAQGNLGAMLNAISVPQCLSLSLALACYFKQYSKYHEIDTLY